MFGIAPFAGSTYAGLNLTNVVAALTGTSASGTVGSLTLSNTVALTGVQTSGVLGTVVATSVETETGDVAYGYVGTASPGISIALTSASAVGSDRKSTRLNSSH